MTETNLYPLSKSWTDFLLVVKQELAALKNGSVIVEIGGGANPYLSKEQVQNFRYIVIDIDELELSKASGEYYEQLCSDITENNQNIKCDLIITHMLLEHIPDPQKFHSACFEMLKDQGRVIHFFATKFSPASVVNLLLPETWSRRLLYAIQNRKWETEGKFPAYYRWCLGPTKRQIARFTSIGYNIKIYNGYLGSSYLSNVPFLYLLERGYNKIVLKLKMPHFCSNAIFVALKNSSLL